MKTKDLIVAIAASALSASPVLAEGLPINPGMWRITSTTTNMMTGQPQTETEDQCMEESTFDPVAEIQDEGDGCAVSDQTISGNTMTFTMTCQGADGPPMVGNARYTVNENDGDGEITYTASFGGQTMTMQSSWVAERVGDC